MRGDRRAHQDANGVRIRRTLRRFIAECRAHRTPVAIALFPHLSAGLPTGAYEYADLHDQVLEICREESVPCVDLRATFAPYRDYVSLWGIASTRTRTPMPIGWRASGSWRCWGRSGSPPGPGARPAPRPRREGQSTRRTGFRSVPIPSIVMLTTSPGASARSSGTRMPVPVESTVPGGIGL